MKFDTKVAWATFGTFFALVVVSVTLIVVLTRSTTAETPAEPSVTPNPFVTPSPQVVRNILLKDAAGDCYEFANTLPPVLGAPVPCVGSGLWVENASGPTLTYDGGVYETCIQPPPQNVPGGPVLGTVGGCIGIQLESVTSTTGTIKDETSGFCINNLSNILVWGSCATAYAFVVDTLS